MNRRFINIIVAFVISSSLIISGCSKKTEETTFQTFQLPSGAVTTTTLRSTPDEATFEQILDELGVDLTVPENATDIHYGIVTIEDGRTCGQVDYKIDGFQIHLRGYNYGDLDIMSLTPSEQQDLINLAELDHTFNSTGGGFDAPHLSGEGTVNGSFNTSTDGYGRLDFFYRQGNTVYSLWVDYGSTEIDMPSLYSGSVVPVGQ